MHEDCKWVPSPVKAHPLGLLAMWGWALLGVALAIPAFQDDPKPWPDILWPAQLSGTPDETYGIAVLATGMTISGLTFIAAQVCLVGRWRWPQFTRHVALWMAGLVNVYIIVSIFIKAFRDPDQVAAWWPASVIVWSGALFLLILATKRSLHATKGERFYEQCHGEK